MYNANAGYHGYSRSVRSKESIDNYEVPLSLIKKDFIKKMEEDLDIQIKYTITFIKYYIVNYVMPSSWHHTSKHFNKTDHYDLIDVINELNSKSEEEIIALNNEQKFKQQMLNKEKQQSTNAKPVLVSFIEDVWVGSRNHPKLISYDSVGVLLGNWIYLTDGTRKSILAKKNHHIKVHKTIRTLSISDKEKHNLKTILRKLKK